MADTKISALTDIGTLAAGDKVPVVKASDISSKSATMMEVAAFTNVLGDDFFTTFGGVASLGYETADANANKLTLDLPAGGAVDVPIIVAGVGIVNKDLTFFNGNTFPAWALVDNDWDSWVKISFTSDDRPNIKVGGAATRLNIDSCIQQDYVQYPGYSGFPYSAFITVGFNQADFTATDIPTVQAAGYNINMLVRDLSTSPLTLQKAQAMYVACGETGSEKDSLSLETYCYKAQNWKDGNYHIATEYGYSSHLLMYAGTIDKMIHFCADTGGYSAGTVTTEYGYLVGNIYNSLGLDCGTTKWAFYSVADPSYFGGNITMAANKTVDGVDISAHAALAATAAVQGHATAAQITKLDAIEAAADVTDATNVAAAGALMLALGGTLADAKFITFTVPGTTSTWSGFCMSRTAHEAFTIGQAGFVNGDEEIALADGTAIATMPACCIATGTISANAAGLFMFWGFMHLDAFAFTHTGGAANVVYVASGTPGLLTTTRPTGSVDVVQPMGMALATDLLFLNPSFKYDELVA